MLLALSQFYLSQISVFTYGKYPCFLLEKEGRILVMGRSFLRERREKMILLILSSLSFKRELNMAKSIIKRYDFLHPFKRTVCYSGKRL